MQGGLGPTPVGKGLRSPCSEVNLRRGTGESPDLPRSDSKLASLMPGWCDTGVITRFTQKAAFKLLCFFDCARSLTSLISTCCAKRLGWGLEYLGALPEVIHSHSMKERERSHPRKKLAQRDSASQGQRPGPTQAPWPALAGACFLPGGGYLLPRAPSPANSPSNLLSALGNKFHHSLTQVLWA